MSLSMLETALPMGLESEKLPQPSAVKKDFLWVGTIEPWKAWQIAFEAFAMARRDGMQGQRLVVIGTGRQHQLARARARELGIAEMVDFLGKQPREEVWDRMRLARGLIFSSVRDTSGNVVLEAMGLGCPVVCFRHQGAALMTDEACALRVLPRGWDQSVADFSTAMVRLAADDAAVAALGEAGRKRAVESFTWPCKIRKMTRFYEKVLGKGSCTRTGTAVEGV